MELVKPQIFISHSSIDLPFVRTLAEDLQRALGNKVTIWYDAHLEGGNLWWRKIMEELSRSTIFLVVCSPAAMASAWVNDEIDLAWRLKNSPAKMQLIPLLYQPCSLRNDLGNLQFVRFLTSTPYEDALQELLQTLNFSSDTLNQNALKKQTKIEARQNTQIFNVPLTLLNKSLRPFLSHTSTYQLNVRWFLLALFFGLLTLIGWASQENISYVSNLAAIAPVAARAYATATSNGTNFGFDAAHTHWNRYERIINKTNVSQVALMWSYSTGGPIGSPVVANGMVYIGSNDHKLYVFDATCHHACTPLWSYTTDGDMLSSPAIAHGMLYVGSGDHKLYAFDAFCRHACSPLWSYTTGGNIISSPTIANGMLYVGSGDNKLYAFNASCRHACTPLWSYAANEGIGSSPTIANGILYVGANDDKFYAFDVSCRHVCTPLWSYKTGNHIFSSAAVANGMVYVGSLDGTFYAFDASCRHVCTPLWIYPTDEPIFSSPGIANGIVYIGSIDRRIYAFDTSCRHSCTPLWSYKTNNYVRSSPMIANGVVYIGSDDDKIYAFDASCRSACTPLWSYTADGAISAVPVVANGMIYIGTDEGEIYAFGLPVPAS